MEGNTASTDLQGLNDFLDDSDGSDSTVLYEVPDSLGNRLGERVSIKERICFEDLLCNKSCALCFRRDEITLWCDHCQLAWCDDQCHFNSEKYSPHSPTCLVRQHNVRIWQTSVYATNGPSAFELYSAKPFCMLCLGDVDLNKGTVCGACGCVFYCSSSCHLQDAGDHFSLCAGMTVEQAKFTRIFDSIFHRDCTESTSDALENVPLSTRIVACTIDRLAADTIDTYSACPEECYQIASRKFEFFVGDRSLCLDFCVSDLSAPTTSSSLATRKMQRDARKQVFLFRAKFPTAMLCLPRGQWLSRLDIEVHCMECFSYVSMALIQTLGIQWLTKNVDDIWILLKERSSVMPCEPCVSVLPLREHSCN